MIVFRLFRLGLKLQCDLKLGRLRPQEPPEEIDLPQCECRRLSSDLEN